MSSKDLDTLEECDYLAGQEIVPSSQNLLIVRKCLKLFHQDRNLKRKKSIITEKDEKQVD